MARIPEPFIRQDYRGLNTAEDKLLRQYLQGKEAEIQSLETVIELGPGELLPADQADSLRRGWQRQSKFKADAVVELPGLIEIVELKDFIRSGHLGQMLSYRYWYSIERDPSKPVQAVVTSPDINPSAVQPTRFHGVEIDMQSLGGERHLAQGEAAQPPFTPPDTGF